MAELNMSYFDENLGAIAVVLTLGDLREIEKALSGINVNGGRINAEQMEQVDQTA
jgi:hypothetical protein